MCPELSHLPPDVLLSNQAEIITYFYKKKKTLKSSQHYPAVLCVCVFSLSTCFCGIMTLCLSQYFVPR